jgi:hypothetical protein
MIMLLPLLVVRGAPRRRLPTPKGLHTSAIHEVANRRMAILAGGPMDWAAQLG